MINGICILRYSIRKTTTTKQLRIRKSKMDLLYFISIYLYKEAAITAEHA